MSTGPLFSDCFFCPNCSFRPSATPCANDGQHSADTNATAAKPTPTASGTGRCNEKLSDLVHAGKYAEAQQLTAGLLLAYPEDQRLIKAKVLWTNRSRSSKTADPAASASATQLAGMEKVD